MADYRYYNPGKFSVSDEQKERDRKNTYWGNQELRNLQYEDYKDPESVLQYQQKLNGLKEPGKYTYANQGMLDDLMKQRNNYKQFNYDVNGDALYQQYKDQYTAQGKMAMNDTMAQAQAMTGGYGNSYAQSVGQQAYQGYMQQLTNKIPELYQLAYDKYNNDKSDLDKRISLLNEENDRGYARYRDDVSDYNNERAYLTDRIDADRSYGMNVWQMNYNKKKDETNSYNDNILSNRNYWSNEANNGYNREYGTWSGNEKLQQEAIQMANDIAAKKNSEQLAQREFELAREKFDLEKLSALTGGSSSADDDFQRYTYAGEDNDNMGNNRFYRNGKEYSVAKGVNPYTGTKNPDAKNGTFSNGYQPNNINGKKLKRSEDMEKITVNGNPQDVWQTPNGDKWYWDGTKNRYLEYPPKNG